MAWPLNVTTAESFLQELINTKNCSGVPRIIYNFNNKNLITFEDNFKSKGDVPMTMYFYFETIAPTDNCFDPEQKNICYVTCSNCSISSSFESQKNYCAKNV